MLGLTQLQLAGLTADALRQRAASGRLHRVHRGVYAVGRPELTARGRWMAATLAYGPTALLAGRSSAALWRIQGSDGATTHITLPSPNARARPGSQVHRSATLTPRPT